MLVPRHSVGSLYSTGEEIEQNQDDAFREVIASCRSLSNYQEPTSIKTAIPQAIAAFIAASFHIVIGISLAYSAILIPQTENTTEAIIRGDLVLSKSQGDIIASIIVIAVPIGCLFAGALMEWIGRLNTIKLAAIPCTLGWISIAIAPNFITLLLGRILTGLGCAIGTSPAIVYITEVARPDLRGSLISTAPTIASFGMIIAYLKGAYMNWRLVAWLNIIYTIVPVIFVQLFVPESPVWLVSKGRMEDAGISLAYLYKGYPKPESSSQSLVDMHLSALQRERESKIVQKIKEHAKTDTNGKIKWNWKQSKMAHFLKPTGYKPIIILFWLFLIQQFSGIYITLFFAVTFFQQVNSEINAYTASIFVGVTRFVMSLGNAWLLKRFKRRKLIMTSSLGMAGCMFISGCFTLWLKKKETDLYWVPVLCFMLYVCSSMIGLLSIPWTMTAELFPTEIRGIGHSLSYSMANILMFIAIQSYRTISEFLGGAYAVQWMFACVSVIGFFFALIFMPETHGKKLSEIEEYFRNGGSYNKNKKTIEQVKIHRVDSKKNFVKNRRPTITLETVKEAEKMIKDVEDDNIKINNVDETNNKNKLMV
ncbi:facilitated trehalose transporter Tret1-2 homolog isoform X2 [Condylostylus longicornis]|uniref:facilitated trehalose transporter Tret1-2 homolog isoform X2 n=1 Tax=Condylostylus longicornis TaxID=2530218 RepID=UPI00244DBD9C|nr:facilitated trehalose transporter Tret1-2 homolog isoform X2 [Condylostylus longicornis]XP_055385980.1 facilitated trehalose transporter Tret1-2 homolog isoform X2 [Condylostylus longicornis]XP_055385988.1 facilitated trehalose transporter Tret1-2 homolog isoform X2 [Condylostylus longicornis]